ncbi:MAG: enoyl-CoA hydratase-related protein [Actinomycetota bacterium]
MALVEVERNVRPHVSVCRLNKPERLNSMSFPLVEALYEALHEIAQDNDCWVVVMTGADRAFCAGLDLHDRGVPPNSQDLGFSRLAMKSMSYMSDVVPALRRIPQPVIAAINGAAYGGGMCLTLGADLRYASTSAEFCSAGVINGLTSSELGATYLLPRAVGTSNAAELLLTGRKIGADEALRIGLVSRVLPDDELLDYALTTAVEMTELSPFGVMMTKQTTWSNLEVSSLAAAIELENRNQLLAGYTGNLDEAIAAFREKRKPVYKE